MKPIIIAKRYRVDRKIGAGGFGLVYSGEEVAIKLTHVQDNPDILRGEKDTYNALSSGIGIPQVRWFGQECEFYALVHDLLGPSLEDLFNYCDRILSLKTILLIADQAISRIEYIHSKGFLHRDIKPDNFLIGVGRQGNTLYTVDFGLAKEFDDAQRNKYAEGLALGGTRRYASINNHNGREQSRGDDLESLGYIFVYFARGSLPWQGLKAATQEERDERIKEIKNSTTGDALCEGALPSEFAAYINYTRSLGFDDKPDYSRLRGAFSRRFRAEGFKYDNVFDWTVKRFNEIRSENSSS